MTPADRAAFFDLFARVARRHGKKPDAELAADYFQALERVPLEELEAAADLLWKVSRYFPKPVDWLEAAQKVRKPSHFVRFAPPVLTPDGRAEVTYHCLRCQDTGWRPDCGCELGRLDYKHHCPAHPFTRAEIAYPRPVIACECRGTNPSWQARYQAQPYVSSDAA